MRNNVCTGLFEVDNNNEEIRFINKYPDQNGRLPVNNARVTSLIRYLLNSS